MQNRYVQFVGQPNSDCWEARPNIAAEDARFSLKDYLDCVLAGQDCQLVSQRSEAEVVLTIGKSELENGISLVDHNFFLEC